MSTDRDDQLRRVSDLSKRCTDVGNRALDLSQSLWDLAARLKKQHLTILLVGKAGTALDGATLRFTKVGHHVTVMNTAVSAYEAASLNPYDWVISDDTLSGQHDGFWLCRQLRKHRPKIRRMLVVPQGAIEPEAWKQHMNSGIVHHLTLQPVLLQDLEERTPKS